MSISKMKTYLLRGDFDALDEELKESNMSLSSLMHYMNRAQKRKFLSQTKVFAKMKENQYLTDEFCLVLLNSLKVGFNSSTLSKLLNNDVIVRHCLENFVFDRCPWLDDVAKKEWYVFDKTSNSLMSSKSFIEVLRSSYQHHQQSEEIYALLDAYEKLRTFEQLSISEKKLLLRETLSSSSSSILTEIVTNGLQNVYTMHQLQELLTKDKTKKKIKLNF